MLRRCRVDRRLPSEVLRRSGGLPKFDVCVIGGGPAGIAAAMRAAQINKKVCLVEAGRLGGTDLWNGSVQSKTLWSIAKSAALMQNEGLCARFMDPQHHLTPEAISSARILDTLRNVSETKERNTLAYIKEAGVHLVEGTATFANAHEVDVHTVGTGEYRALQAEYFIIATGSRPREHPLFPSDRKSIITSDDLFRIPIPKSMVIIGTGALGCEFASMYANLGKTRVYLIGKSRRILPKEDVDVARHVHRSLVDRGVTIYLDHQLIDLETYDGEGEGDETACQYTIQSSRGGAVESVIVERALMATGRVASYAGLGLENTQMRVRNGFVEVDDHNRCAPYSHIYCVGDAVTPRRIVNVAEAQGRMAIEDIYDNTTRPTTKLTDQANISRVVFYDEEVASIGLNELQCREAHIGYIVAKYEYPYLTRALIAGEVNGFVKLLVSNDREKRVLGVRAVGTHSGSVVEVASLAIRNRQSVYELLKLNAAYPSMVLGLIECARMTVQRGALKPNLDGVSLKAWKPENIEHGRAFY